MRLVKFRVQNYRSIVDSGEIRIEPFQALVGENNAGKSNILYALNAFLSAKAGGVQESDFFDSRSPIIFTATFAGLTSGERKKLRKYLLGDKLVFEKRILLQQEDLTSKKKIVTEYHGYEGIPKDWWLSTDGVIAKLGQKPDWKQVALDNNILEYVQDERGNVNKTSYERGIDKLLIEREDIEFEEPVLGSTQALGLQPVLLDYLPAFHMLPAITDFSEEIDKRSTSTNFRKLMADLAQRVIVADSRYPEVEKALSIVSNLLNPPGEGEIRAQDQVRLDVLSSIEDRLTGVVYRLMPSVRKIVLKVDTGSVQEIFSAGVTIKIDDGVLTDVLAKGQGLQRMTVFGLLQAVILNNRGELMSIPPQASPTTAEIKRIILAIEEPELYIHPQMQRLIFGILRSFSESDQVIYSTHAPTFVDLARYEAIGVVRKETVETGTKVLQCDSGIFEGQDERKLFQFLSSFDVEKNRMFFASKVILVDGEEDVIALIATGRCIDLFTEFPEELGFTIVDIDGKEQMPKYMRLLSAFKIPYAILHELDGDPNDSRNATIRSLIGENRSIELPNNLEQAVGHEGHFGNKYYAKKYFENYANIPEDFRNTVRAIFSW